jgi:outer membrane protein assembly factor BamE (lipoprotein component of BamABCDE complex)
MSACTSAGVHVSEDQVSKYRKGTTTMDQVIADLGQPTTRSVDEEGNVTLTYTYTETTVRPETFIPYIGGIVTGGTDVRSNSAVLIFNKGGILKSYNVSGSQMGQSMGINSGAPGGRVEQKDRVE